MLTYEYLGVSRISTYYDLIFEISDEPRSEMAVFAIPTYDRRRFECKKLTESEALLIDTMEIHARNGVLTGRFLTMHKRRRKKLTTRSLSPDLAPALLDDVHHGLVKVSDVHFSEK